MSGRIEGGAIKALLSIRLEPGATHGEFRLTPLPGGRTRLEGRTTYVVDMFPQAYWAVPARAIVTAIHSRVLHHIQTLAEELQ